MYVNRLFISGFAGSDAGEVTVGGGAPMAFSSSGAVDLGGVKLLGGQNVTTAYTAGASGNGHAVRPTARLGRRVGQADTGDERIARRHDLDAVDEPPATASHASQGHHLVIPVDAGQTA